MATKAAVAAKTPAAKKAAPSAAAPKPKAAAAPAMPASLTIVTKLPPVPKKPAEMADQLYAVRQDRLKLAKVVEAFEKRESELREKLIELLPKGEATGTRGKLASVYIENKEIATVKDWDGFHKWLLVEAKKDSGAWAMLQRRVNDSVMLEVMGKGKKITGVEKGFVPVVRMNKV